MDDPTNRRRHLDFKTVEASRPDWNPQTGVRLTKTADPNWRLGSGPNHLEAASLSHGKRLVSMDPNDRPPSLNYKLLISAITPRPIALVSTLDASGKSANLAPFSYFNVVNDDPPAFVIGFSSCVAEAKDTLKNLIETKECVINIISEPILEAANSTAVNAPPGFSEWDVSGLTPDYCCETVQPARVKEAVFSIEATLQTLQEFDSKSQPGSKSGTMVVLEGTRFWIREDAMNEEKTMVDLAVLRPMSRLGGISYGRTTESVELRRLDFQQVVGGTDGYENLKRTSVAGA